jgi:ATP-dependent Clp protease ATP-binding subunit ClpA
MQPTEPIPRRVDVTRPAGRATTMGRWEASRLHHPYVGPEHLLLGLLRQGDNPAARVLVAHGLDLETVRAEVDRLIAQGVLPGPAQRGRAAPPGRAPEAVAGRPEPPPPRNAPISSS